MKQVITLEHVYKDFGNVTVLNDLSFSVSEGEIFGLLGPSGAGKTTIIRILTGQLSATRGTASVFGANTKHITEDIYSKIGMVLDNSGLYARLNCRDNLRLFADVYGLDKACIEPAMEAVKLKDAMKRRASGLSKGMAQRLVFARAIMHKPKLLFLDEPTSGLDPATLLEIHELIFHLRKNGTTIFLTTHNMTEASKLCDNVALLNEGSIAEYGAPDALCRRYNHKQTISVLLKDGKRLELPSERSSCQIISGLFENELVESIHSSEPNLESVFISLTGRKLV